VRLTSQLGDGLLQAGLAGSVFFNPERAASSVAIAMAFAVLLLPYSAVGPFVGVFLDRWSRRQILVGANVSRALLVLPAAWMVWYGIEGTLFVVTALLIIALNRFFLAGVSASLPHVADAGRLVTANSLATTAGSVMYAIGLATAAGIFHGTGTGYHPYAVVAATASAWYGLSAGLTMISFRIAALGPDDAERSRDSLLGALADTGRGMIAGLRHLAKRPVAAAALSIQAAHRGLYGVLAIMTLLLYRNYFHPDDPAGSVAGLLPIAAAGAVGAFVAASITPAATRRLGGRTWVAVLLAALAVGVPALCLPYREALTTGAAALLAISSQGIKIVTETALQVEMEDDYRGRVFSVNDTAFNISFVAGLFLGALLLPVDGHAPLAIILVGLAYALLAAWTARRPTRPADHHETVAEMRRS
jgi:MFS family permease